MPTATFNPVAGANSPVDGQMNDDALVVFATVRGSTTATSASATETTAQFAGGFYNLTENQIQRAAFLFDTSTLGAGATITSATFSLFITSVNNGANTWPGSNTYLALVKVALGSNANVTTSDYNIANWTFTKQATDLAWASLTTNNQYYDWALNSTGLASINKAGVTSFGIVNGNDFDNVAYTNGTNFGFSCQYADAALNSPKLVVTYTTPSSFLPLIGVGK